MLPRDAASALLVSAMFTCDECQTPSIARAIKNDYFRGEDLENWLSGRDWNDLPEIDWIPKAASGRKFPDVPSEIAAAASEAYECHSVDAHRAACSMARAVIEAAAKDKGITEKGIYGKIEKLGELGFIRSHIKEAAHEVRYLGNDTAHGDFVVPVEKAEAAEILGLMDEVLNEVYQSPAKVARRRAARQAKSASD